MEVNSNDVLAVNTCKEAKHTDITESLSTTVARTEQLGKIVKDQKARKDERGAVISEQLLWILCLAIHANNIMRKRNKLVRYRMDLEEKSNQDVIEMENIEEAIMWYRRVLGFQTEGGEGVKFIFHNIDMKNLEEQYAFTVRLDGDIYKLLDCDPYLEGFSEMIKDLDKTNDLFKFVRIMRQKFQVAILNGALPTVSPLYLDASSVTISSPPPASVDSRSEVLMKENIPHFQPKKAEIKPHQRVKSGQVAVPSVQSISALRMLPLVMAKKQT